MKPLTMLMERAETDRRLIARNQRHGDDISRPRQVRFELVAKSEAHAIDLSGLINALGYGDAAAIESVQGSVMSANPGEWRVVICMLIPLSPHQLVRTSALMAALASLLGVHYDGWGCHLMTTQQAPGADEPQGNH